MMMSLQCGLRPRRADEACDARPARHCLCPHGRARRRDQAREELVGDPQIAIESARYPPAPLARELAETPEAGPRLQACHYTSSTTQPANSVINVTAH
jgi:hypothetical protein